MLWPQKIYFNGFDISNFFQSYEIYYYFCSQERFSQTKIFPWFKKFSINKDFSLIKDNFHRQRFFLIDEMFHSQTSFLLTLILDPLNTKSYAKVLTLTISFLRTCKLILISIKKLTLYNVSTECTSVHKN